VLDYLLVMIYTEAVCGRARRTRVVV